MKRKNKNRQNSNDLYAQLKQTKQTRNNYSQQIKSKLKQDNIVLKKSQSNASILNPNTNPSKLGLQKQKSLNQLSRSLSQRIQIDKESKIKLGEMNNEYFTKKNKIQKKIEEVKRRNINRMKQLNEFEVKYLKKLNKQYEDDKQREQNLLVQYQLILEQENKMKKTEAYRKEIQAEDWQQILQKKSKLERMIREYTHRQKTLVRQNNPEQVKRVKQAVSNLNEKQLQILNNKLILPKIKVDAKEIGNQYLQYAKKFKQPPKDKLKNKLLDINLKCIEYSSDIMDKITRNTGDLSSYNNLLNAQGTKNSLQKSKLQHKSSITESKEGKDLKRSLK